LDELFKQLQEKDLEISEMQRTLNNERHNFKTKEEAHRESQNDAEGLQNEIDKLRQAVNQATQAQFKLKSQSINCKDLQH